MSLQSHTKATISATKWKALLAAISDSERIRGLTHEFYQYPARFSPTFAGTAIDLLSQPGDVVLDPYMGGGTSIVEGWTRQRKMIGVDINDLAVFTAKTKTTLLKPEELRLIYSWTEKIIPKLTYDNRHHLQVNEPGENGKNLELRNSRYTKPLVKQALGTIDQLSPERTRRFLRMAVLKTTKIAWDGRKAPIKTHAFRSLLKQHLLTMLDGTQAFTNALKNVDKRKKPKLICGSAETLCPKMINHRKVDLVVTSPPYPGVHMLYHRWQIDGRKESPAPYWIANCDGGRYSNYYTFGGRGSTGSIDNYFETAHRTHKAIRSVMKKGAYFVQLIAFNNKAKQLSRYLESMANAGFREVTREGSKNQQRLWRQVPNRKWYTRLSTPSSSSREVALVHIAG